MCAKVKSAKMPKMPKMPKMRTTVKSFGRKTTFKGGFVGVKTVKSHSRTIKIK